MNSAAENLPVAAARNLAAKEHMCALASKTIHVFFWRKNACALVPLVHMSSCATTKYSVCAKLRSPTVLVALPSDLSLGSIDT